MSPRDARDSSAGKRIAVKRTFVTSIVVALLTHLPLGQAETRAGPPPVSDVRVLIDVSGSMKKNDPHDLRAPALRLIVGLLPPGAKAGVWTFGQYVNMLVPHGVVDKAWRHKARAASRQINSAGLFTNIEEALKRSTWDWNEPDPHVKRSVIMLTDGLVDVSKDDAEDAASRHRILDKILPRLRRAGVTIHTIALSTDADRSLLKQLAAGTGGRYEEVDGADALEKAFLHMFERSAHRDSLPLTHNEVRVDDHIQELTLLIFRKHDARPTRLVTPSLKTIAQQDAPANMRWHHESGYDLITVERPAAGRWKVLAGEDPDNRVMVVTNLKLQVTQLPAQALADRSLALSLRLTEKGRVITRQSFLKFVDATLIQNDVDGKTWRWPIKDDGVAPDKKAHDGIYTFRLGASLTPGRHEFRILVDGITFQRESRQLVTVYKSPVITSLKPVADKGAQATLSIIPRAGLIDPATMKVQLIVKDPGGETQTVEIPRVHDNEWRKTLGDGARPGVYHVDLKIRGRSPGGEAVDYERHDMTFGKAVKQAPRANPVAHKPAAPAARRHSVAAPPQVRRGRPHWTVVASLLIAVNLVLIGAAYIGLRRSRAKTRLSVTALEEELA